MLIVLLQVGVVGSALLATHLGVPGILTAAIGGVLAISGLLLMKGRWRSLKYYYGQNVAEHGLKLRRDLNASLQRELERTYGKRLESIIDMYQRAHGHHLNLVDDKGYQVKEELRVVRNISTELRRLL